MSAIEITTIDCHAAGEPLRIVTGGVPAITGATILDKRDWARAHLDGVRRLLMWEPRGHADMYGCFLTEPVRPDSELGVLFMHNEGFSTMCGHGVIGLVTTLIETGRLAAERTSPPGPLPVPGRGSGVGRGSGEGRVAGVAGGAAVCDAGGTAADRVVEGQDGEVEAEVRLDTPAGQVVARARVMPGEAPRVREVAFRNVPSFLWGRVAIETPSLGELEVDVAYGGAFYTLVDADRLGVPIAPGNVARLIALGMEIKHAVEAHAEVVHPEDARLGGIYGTIICDRPSGAHADARNLTVFASGEVDRSPCGTGTCARMAQLHARGRLPLGQPFRHESGTGTVFTGRLLAETTVAGRPAVVPEIAGRAWITGYHRFVVSPDDPLRAGFLLR